MNDFGIFAKDQLAKVTMDTGKYGKIIKVPVSIGWKNKDVWTNEFFDVIVFEKLWPVAETISKGDKIKVSGRLQLSEWTNKTGTTKKQWSILADELSVEGAKPPYLGSLPDDEENIPF